MNSSGPDRLRTPVIYADYMARWGRADGLLDELASTWRWLVSLFQPEPLLTLGTREIVVPAFREYKINTTIVPQAARFVKERKEEKSAPLPGLTMGLMGCFNPVYILITKPKRGTSKPARTSKKKKAKGSKHEKVSRVQRKRPTSRPRRKPAVRSR